MYRFFAAAVTLLHSATIVTLVPFVFFAAPTKTGPKPYTTMAAFPRTTMWSGQYTGWQISRLHDISLPESRLCSRQAWLPAQPQFLPPPNPPETEYTLLTPLPELPPGG